MTSGVTKQCLVSAVVLMRGKKSVASPFFGYTRFRETPADVFLFVFLMEIPYGNQEAASLGEFFPSIISCFLPK